MLDNIGYEFKTVEILLEQILLHDSEAYVQIVEYMEALLLRLDMLCNSLNNISYIMSAIFVWGVICAVRKVFSMLFGL